AFIFLWGLSKLLKSQPYPWIGLMVAFPYLIIVVSMGYMRQAVAIGFVMAAIAYLQRGSFFKYVVFVTLAVLFHKSAILMMAFGIFDKGKGKFFKLLALVLIAIGVYVSFVSKQANELWQNYVVADMKSQGAYIRAILNLIPALILFKFRKKWQEEFEDYNFWKMIALGVILAFILVPFASTAVDRMALYFIPLQIVVFSRLPVLLKNKIPVSNVVLLIFVYYLTILLGWLFLAAHSAWWQPYRNYIFEVLL
ncbi:EpsG family protein, partial [Caminibacter sp.]